MPVSSSLMYQAWVHGLSWEMKRRGQFVDHEEQNRGKYHSGTLNNRPVQMSTAVLELQMQPKMMVMRLSTVPTILKASRLSATPREIACRPFSPMGNTQPHLQ